MSDYQSTVTVEPPYEPAPVRTASRWTLTGTRPGRLAARLVVAAAAVGVAGGAVTALLTMLFGFAAGSAMARQVAIGLPVALFVMIVWRLVAGLAGAGRGPSSAGVVLSAGVLLGLSALILGLPMFDEFTANFAHNAGVGLLAAFVGAQLGLLYAGVAVAVLVPGLLLARAVGARIPLAGVQVLLAVVVMAVTGLLSMGPSELDIPVFAAMALTGIGAVLTSRWVLVERVRADRAA